MSRERKYQAGKFENYNPERDELRRSDISGMNTARDFEVTQGRNRDVGGRAGADTPHPRASHRGKGPRNYQRRDERILEDVNDRLCDNPYIDASEIDVSVSEGNVVLSGTVDNRESKRLAEDIGDSVSGVKNTENRLRVRMKGI